MIKKVHIKKFFQNYISTGAKRGGRIPILDKYAALQGNVDVNQIVNPLPHVLTLTAIVVGVATLGVALALCSAIYRTYGSLDEEEILKKLE